MGLKVGICGAAGGFSSSFISVVQQKLPSNHVWLAARYNAPGIIAHESAKRGGELMKIPDFGVPPAGTKTLPEVYPLQE